MYFLGIRLWYQFSCGISKMVGPKKIFAQESTCSKEILTPSALNYLWSSVVGVVKVDYFEFPSEIFEILCELDVRGIACNF